MSNPILDSLGNIIGFRSGGGGDFAGGGASGSWDIAPPTATTYNSADTRNPDDETANRIRDLRYPLAGGNSHYVRFYINVTEEARLIKTNKVATTGYVDYSEQDRAYRNQTSADAISTGAGIAAGVAVTAAGVGSAISGGVLRGAAATKALFKSKGSIGGLTAGVASVIGTGAAAALGYGAVNANIPGTNGSIADAAIDTFKLTQRLKRLAASISLYTPANVRANYNFSYDMPDDLLVHLAQQDNYDAIKKGLQAMASPITGLADGPGGFMADVGKAGAAGAAAVGSVGRILTATTQTGSMLSRSAVNKKRDIMFQHVGNRMFSFEYVFAPKSAEEAKEVDDIIFMFKYFAHPEMLEGYGNFLYLYPAEFDIEYGMITNDGTSESQMQNKYLNKISSCVLTAIDINYAPNTSFQSLENGEPPVVTLTMQFQEIETLHRDRIAKGY